MRLDFLVDQRELPPERAAPLDQRGILRFEGTQRMMSLPIERAAPCFEADGVCGAEVFGGAVGSRIRNQEESRFAFHGFAFSRERGDDHARLNRDDADHSLDRCEDARHARLSRVLAVDEEGAEGDRQQDGGDAQEREGNGPDEQDSAEPGSRARVLGLRAKEAALHQECAAAQSSGRLDAVRSESCAVHR